MKVWSAGLAALPAGCIARPLEVRSPYASAIPEREAATLVNDVHSQLNATRVSAIVKPRTIDELHAAIAGAKSAGTSISVAGGRHAMGGQQFGEANLLLDMRDLNRVLAFDATKGTITVEGGIQWPQLIADGIMNRFEERIRDGYLYGDYQFTTDATRDSFLRRGVFSCYQPVPLETPLTASPTRFEPEDWARLTFYSHTHKRRAFEAYSSRYLKTSGQVYWADAQLSAAYVDNYHADLDRAVHAKVKGTEMITEIYVERTQLAAFMEQARLALRERRANMIYGTVRLIEKDDETFLTWARDRYACVIFNLHIEHTPQAIENAASAFRELIDLGISHGGSYYLTYHRWARKDQVERCYPQMREFLMLKRKYDPNEAFQSTWYRHYRTMFTGFASS